MDQPDDLPPQIKLWAPWTWRPNNQIALAFVLVVLWLLAKGYVNEVMARR